MRDTSGRDTELRPLFEYQIEENRIENGKFIVKGSHRRVNAISDTLGAADGEWDAAGDVGAACCTVEWKEGTEKMIAIETLACAGLVTGLFLLLNLNISEFTEGLFDSFIHPRQGSGKKSGNRQGNERRESCAGRFWKHRKCLN